MKEPQRLLEQGQELEVALLRSALTDAPSPGAKRRMLLGLGIASGVVVASSEATAAGALGTMGLAGLWKWVGIGVLGGAAMIGAAETVTPRTTAVTRAVIEQAPPQPTRPVVQEVSVVEQIPMPPASSGPIVAARPLGAAPASGDLPSPRASSLSDEVRLLDGARDALAAGNAKACLDRLDRYRADYPRGVLALEASVLRIEALEASGARTQARELGNRFLEAHPSSPHAARVRSLIGADTIP